MSDDADPPTGPRLAKALGFLVAARTAWRTARRRELPASLPEPAEDEVDPSERTVPANRRAETVVAVLLALAAVFGFGFTAVYVVAETNTQLLGIAMGGALALLAAAAIVAGKLVVVQETSVEERDQLLDEPQAEQLIEVIEAGGEGISRRVLLAGAGGLAGAAVITAAVAPLASLGPPSHSLHASPWTRGIRLVDDEGHVYAADAIQIGSFYTALPEGESPEVFGAGLLVVRLPPQMIHLPASRATWTPDGIMAFSKICPHAGCAISLYRYPTYEPTSAEPAFTCPCHYSTFTPGDGGKVIFGPAGRALPQLPLMIDGEGNLRAAGRFDEDVGPSWWGVRRT
ncbi:MAG TPA: Rieske (2Fe-2S) protein [Solirubrobacteraceae bacterium]|jgi:ubiquinol-cytochrome c reductase iron-sulfur subunit